MKLMTYNSVRKQPLLMTNDGAVINLNTLQKIEETEDLIPVKAGMELKISKHKNDNFLIKAEKFFKISRVAKAYGTSWYKLDAGIILFAIIKGDTLQLVGNYPIHYLKLIYRYIKHPL